MSDRELDELRDNSVFMFLPKGSIQEKIEQGLDYNEALEKAK